METIGSLEAMRVYEATGVRVERDPARRTAMEKRMVEAWSEGAGWEMGRCKVCATPFVSELG